MNLLKKFRLYVIGALALVLLPGLVMSQSDPPEMRVAIIVVFDNIKTTSAIQTWVDEIASLKYNAIAVHARYRGDATYFPNKYNSTYPNNEPRTSAAGTIDVIEEFTTRGHAAGLKVFAYVNCWLVTDGKDTDSRSNHIVNTNPGWRTYAYNGGSPVVQTIAHDGEGLWLDPALPAARQRVADICGDIMSNYNCDGIILDRIRYPQTGFTRTSKDFGYHPDAIAAFHAQYGGSGVPNPSDTNWIAFRQQQISLSVQAGWNTITAIHPHNMLLSYPIGRFNDAHNYCYQKWEDWLTGGYSDAVLPQIYSTSNSTFSTSCDQNKAAYSGPRLLGAATMAYQSSIDVAGQIQILRDKGFAGVSPYRHGSMGALGYFTHLQQKFVNVAPWPDMPWKSAEVIVDNPSATFSGTWSSGTSATDKYGSDYRYATSGSGGTATFNGNLNAGSYEVYCWYPQGTNRANNAPYTINYNGGSQTIAVNQQANGGMWNLLGTFSFVDRKSVV